MWFSCCQIHRISHSYSVTGTCRPSFSQAESAFPTKLTIWTKQSENPCSLQAASAQTEREREKQTGVLVPKFQPENQSSSRINKGLERDQEFYTKRKSRHIGRNDRNGERVPLAILQTCSHWGGFEFTFRGNMIGKELARRLLSRNMEDIYEIS